MVTMLKFCLFLISFSFSSNALKWCKHENIGTRKFDVNSRDYYGPNSFGNESFTKVLQK